MDHCEGYVFNYLKAKKTHQSMILLSQFTTVALLHSDLLFKTVVYFLNLILYYHAFDALCQHIYVFLNKSC